MPLTSNCCLRAKDTYAREALERLIEAEGAAPMEAEEDSSPTLAADHPQRMPWVSAKRAFGPASRLDSLRKLSGFAGPRPATRSRGSQSWSLRTTHRTWLPLLPKGCMPRVCQIDAPG